MTEVKFWLLTMSEQDIPVLFPSSIALTTSPTGGRVSLLEPHMPPTLTSIQSRSEQSLTAHSYEYCSMNDVTMAHLPITVKQTGLMEEKPPEDTPAMLIAPKPPHSTACAKHAMITAPHQTTTAMMFSK